MNAEEREKFDAALTGADFTALKKELTAAWYTSNTVAAGEAGSVCSAEGKCTGTNHCCGTSTGAGVDGRVQENTCADLTTLSWKDDLGVVYTHVCGASKLMVAITAALSAAYLM